MKKTGLFILLAALILPLFAFWAWDQVRHPTGNLLVGETAGQLLAYGRLAGLLAAFGLLLQLLLAGRTGWVERACGLDRMMLVHHASGFALLLLLLAHPALVTAGHAQLAGVGLWEQYADFCRSWKGVLAAVIGLNLILVAVALSVAVVRKRLRYELWYASHTILYVAIALVFLHQLAVGSDFTDNRWFARYWLVLYLFTFGNLLAYRLVRPLWNFARYRFVVARLLPETGDATSLFITGRNLEKFPVTGGQFLSVRFLAPGFRWESHPFSVSQQPDGRQIRLTIKASGDFTRRLPLLPPGTPVVIDGPHGIFTARRCRSPKVLLIAGGIGITPIRAMADDLLAAGRDVTLLYANRTLAGAVFRTELDALAAAAGGRFRVIHVLTQDAAWSGEKGQLDRERIARLVPDAAARTVFLCGPPPMMTAVRRALLGLGVPRERIFYERFAL